MPPPPFDPSELDVPNHLRRNWEAFILERDRVRGELRARINWRLVRLTGRLHARMRWTRDEYLSIIVRKYRCMIIGWPDGIPFRNLSEIAGGVRPLRQLLDAWMCGKLRIIKLSAAELANALSIPENVLPKSICSSATKPSNGRVFPLVLHPDDMHDISRPAGKVPHIFGTSTSSPTFIKPRKMRTDTKRPRCSDKPLRRKRRGLCTPEYVHEPARDTESEREEGSSRGLKRLRVAFSEEYIHQISAAEPMSDDIESASESWQLGSGSDRDEPKTDGREITLDSDPIEMYDE